MKERKLKTYVLKTPYEGMEEVVVAPFVSRYQNNNRLAIFLEDVKTGEDFGVLTVNLDYDLSNEDLNNLAFVDTNNMPYILGFIKENELGRETLWFGMSGYCTYPEYSFDLSKLNSFEDYEAYCNGELKYEE